MKGRELWVFQETTGTLAFTASTSTVAENGGALTIPVQLSTGGSPLDSDVSVQVAVTGGTATNGTDYATFSATTLTFARGTTNGTTKTVTLTPSDDNRAEGNETVVLTLQTVSGPGLINSSASSHTVTITDNDAAGITVSPTSGLVTTEAGGTATFTVKLTSQPTANVTVGSVFERHDGRHGFAGQPDVHGGELERGSDGDGHGRGDAVVDGNVAYTIVTAPAASSDRNYNGLNAADVSVTNQDNDAVGITVSPTSGLVTTEAGGTATFTVKLTSQPTANVTMGLSTSDTAEGTVSPASLTFTRGELEHGADGDGHGRGRRDGGRERGLHDRHGAAASSDANYNGAECGRRVGRRTRTTTRPGSR